MPDGPDRATIVRQKLLVDRHEAFQGVVSRAEKVLRLDDTGGIHPSMDLAKLGARQKVCLFLLGRYLASVAGLADHDTATDHEISKFFGMKVLEVQKRAHDLKAIGRIEQVSSGVYRLTETRASEILSDLGA